MRTPSRGWEIAHQVFGATGPTVLLLSGLLPAGQDWVGAGYVERLTPANQVVAVDPLGFGQSDRPHNVDAYDLDGQVADMIAVLDAVGVEEAVVWGYSMGCVVATALAEQEPQRTSALVLGGFLVGLTPVDRANIFTWSAATMLEDEGVPGYVDENMPFLDAPTRDRFIARNDPVAAGAAVRSMAMPQTAETAPLPGETFNYVGTREPWYEVAEAVAATHGVEFQGVPDADHSGAFRAVDVVVPMVQAFLS